MQIEKRLKNYYRRWNINLDNGEEFIKLKNRIISIIDKSIGHYLVLNPKIDEYFFEIFNLDKADEPNIKKSQTVIQVPPLAKSAFESLYSETEKGFGDTNVYKCIKDCENSQNLAKILQFVFWVLEERHNETQDIVSGIVKEIRKVSVLTPSTAFQIYKKGKQIIIYPYGDPFLDKEIIDTVLSRLENYPKVAKDFEGALKIYQSGDRNKFRNLLDNLRFALEQLLKDILNNKKSLENQKELLKWLDKKGLHNQVGCLYKQLLETYTKYQNEAVKHNEAFSVNEVEFMIYLTGNFMRLILNLEIQENDSINE